MTRSNAKRKPNEPSDEVLQSDGEIRRLTMDQIVRYAAWLRDEQRWHAANAIASRRHRDEDGARAAEQQAAEFGRRAAEMEATIHGDLMALNTIEVERDRRALERLIAELSAKSRRGRRGARERAAAAMQALIAWRDHRAWLASRLRAAERALLIIDEQWLPSPSSPGRAHLEMQEVLTLLARHYRLAIQSLRPAQEAAGDVGVAGITYVGGAGAEQLTGQKALTHPLLEPWRSRVGGFARISQRAVATLGMRLVLSAGVIATFDWRDVPDPPAAQEAAEEIARQASADGLAVRLDLDARRLEIRPPIRFNAGIGVSSLDLGSVSDAVYVGNDADVIATTRELLRDGAVTIAVGVNPPVEAGELSNLILEGSPAVLAFLRLLVIAD